MASGSSPTAYGPSPLSELRIVLLGKIGAGKSDVANVILGGEDSRREGGRCVKKAGEVARRRVIVVHTPGWDRVSVQRTPEQVKQEIVQSVTLCPPGPHALLLVLPVSVLTNVPSAREIKAASQHVELLSKRAWKYTMVLFVCQGELEGSVIDQHINSAGKLLNKCGGRFCVFQSRTWKSQTQVFELLEKVEEMVAGNFGDYLIPQIYYDLIESRASQDLRRTYEDREEQLKYTYTKREEDLKRRAAELERELNLYKTGAVSMERDEEEPSGKKVVRQRSRSFEMLPPKMSEEKEGRAEVQQTQESKKQPVDLEAIKRGYREEVVTLVRYYLKPAALILAAFIGALMGAIAGSPYGVLGTCSVIVIGSVIHIPLAMLLIAAARVARDNSPVHQIEGTANQRLDEGRQCSKWWPETSMKEQ